MDIRLISLALGAFAIGSEGFVVSSLLPQIGADTGVTITQGGYLVLAFALAYALGGPVLTALVGHRDRRTVLASSAGVFALGNLMAALAGNFEMLVLARVVMAVAAGLYAATAQATAVAISPARHRARAISVIVGGTTLAVALGAPAGALIAGLVGWRGTFLSLAVLSIVAAAAVAIVLPAGLAGGRLPLRDRLAALRTPGLPPLLATTVLVLAGPFVLFTYIAPFVTRGLALDAELLPGVLLAFGIGAAVGNFAGGQTADRYGATRTVVLTLLAVSAIMATAGALPELPFGLRAAGLMGFMLVWGAIGWAFPPAQASRVIAVAGDAPALALSLNASAIYLGVALGSLIGGQALPWIGTSDLGPLAALFPLAGLAVLWVTRPQPGLAAARLG